MAKDIGIWILEFSFYLMWIAVRPSPIKRGTSAGFTYDKYDLVNSVSFLIYCQFSLQLIFDLI